MPEDPPTIALIGLRCSGKTRVGRRLATQLARQFIDLDVELAHDFARERSFANVLPAGSILARFGDAVFREAEANTLLRVLARKAPSVIATGGGVVERATNRERLRAVATCVWLDVAVPELERRMRASRDYRPALLGIDPTTEIGEVAARRAPLYAEVAHHVVDCAELDVDAIARRIETLVMP